MKRRVAMILSVVLVLGSMVPKAMGNIEPFKEGDVIVKYIGERPPETKGVNIKEVYHFQNAQEGEFSLVHYTSHVLDTQKLIERLQKVEGVIYAESNASCYMTALTNDPYVSNMWYLRQNENSDTNINNEDNQQNDQTAMPANINIESLWVKDEGLKENVVAIIDTGVDYTHPDLVENMWENTTSLPGKYGYNFIDDNADPMDEVGHGTHCAGIIAAKVNNEIGIAGISHQTKIMALKHIDASGEGKVSQAIAAYQYVLDAQKEGVNIVAICNAWGSKENPKALEDIIVAAGEAGIISVCAAGNNRTDLDQDKLFPPGYNLPYTIVVGASTPNDEMASFSNYGKYTVDVFAPGTSMLSTYSKEAYIPALSDTNEVYLGFEDNQIGFNGANISITDQIAFEGKCGLVWQLKKDEVPVQYEVGSSNTPNSITLDLPTSEAERYFGLSFWSQCPANNPENMPTCYVEAYNNGKWENIGAFNIEANNYWTSESFKLIKGTTKVRLVATGITEASKLYLDDVGVGKSIGKYCYLQGTSMSAALVSGEVAMLRRLFPNEEIIRIRDRVIGGVKQLPSSLVSASGRVDMKRAVENPYAVMHKLIRGDNGNIKIKGQFFGINPGTICLNGEALEVMAWTDTEITAKYMGNFTGLGEFVLTRYNGDTTNQLLLVENKAYGFTRHTPLPIALSHMAVANHENKIYVTAGMGEDYTPNEALLVYDIKTDTWTQLADLPQASNLESYARGARMVPMKQHLLLVVFDQSQAKNMYYVYNIKDDVWEEKSYEIMPSAREYPALINYGNEVYMIGGLPKGAHTGNVEISREIWKLNKEKTWEKVGMLNEGRYAPIVDIVGDSLVITGGYNTVGKPLVSTEIYNGKEIISGANLPFDGVSNQNTVYGGGEKLYIMTDGMSFPAAGIVYNKEANNWEESPYRLSYTTMEGMGSVAGHNRLYSIGGVSDYRPVRTLESMPIEGRTGENIKPAIAPSYVIGAIVLTLVIILIILLLIWIRKKRKPKKLYVR